MLRRVFIAFFCFGWLAGSAAVLASEQVKLYRFKSLVPGNEDYNHALLERVLRVTEAEYGPYRLQVNDSTMVRERLRMELMDGRFVNVIAVSFGDDWQQAIRIPYPIRKGLGSYRLLLVRNEHKHLLQPIDTIELIKQFRTGTLSTWTSSNILQAHDFNVVFGPNYESLFGMLALGRFDTFMRGVNEVFDELTIYQAQYPNLRLEQHGALFSYLPNYFYVSPSAPTLAKRIKRGLALLLASGEFEQIFAQYFGDDIKAAGLAERKIFYMENTAIPAELYQTDKRYLLDFELLGERTPHHAP